MMMAEYTVQTGDTLGKIAHQVMGSANRWPKLYGLNQKSIIAEQMKRDPHRVGPDWIYPGMTLAVPDGDDTWMDEWDRDAKARIMKDGAYVILVVSSGNVRGVAILDNATDNEVYSFVIPDESTPEEEAEICRAAEILRDVLNAQYRRTHRFPL